MTGLIDICVLYHAFLQQKDAASAAAPSGSASDASDVVVRDHGPAVALDSGDKGGGEEITVDGDDDEDDDDEDDEDNDDGGVEASVTDIDLNASQWDTPRAAKGAQSIGNKAPAWAADRAAAIAAAGAQGPLNGRVASGTLPETFQDSESGLCIVNAALYVDEWEDDDDVGYIYVQLTEDEFFEMMEEVGPPVHPLACQEGFFSPPSLSPSLSHTHTHTLCVSP